MTYPKNVTYKNTFKDDTTEDYTQDQLDELNEELSERLEGIELETDEWYEATSNFNDEVSRR